MEPNQPIDNKENDLSKIPKEPNMRIFVFLKLMCAVTIFCLFAECNPKGLMCFESLIILFCILGLNIGAHLVGFGKGVKDALEYGYDKGLERGTNIVMNGVTEELQKHLNELHKRHASGDIPKQTKKDTLSKQQRLDALLDKLSIKGIEGLTPEEKQELNKLSE